MPSGRNDPCPCGSGRKFKKCCALEAGELHRLGVLAVAAGRHDQAEPLLRQAVARQPDCAPYHVNLGVALSGLGRREEAAAECREALRLAPDFVEALSNLGCILRDLARPEEALPYLERAAALAPQSAPAKQIVK